MTISTRWIRNVLKLIGALTAGYCAIPILVHVLFVPISFNQFLIHQLELRHGCLSGDGVLAWTRSLHSSGMNVLFGHATIERPPIDDPAKVFAYVYSWIPPYAVVYPTEGFYYFSTVLQGKRIMGNVRVADLRKKTISFAYFTIPEKNTWHLDVSESLGLAVEEKSARLFEVSFGGKDITFAISNIGAQQPKHLARCPDEEFVGQVHDESGVRLFLLYNVTRASFYYVLNEEEGLTETLHEYAPCYYVGGRTGFAFFEDKEYGRKLLVGVLLDNVKQNNYFDGPGDQVPYYLDLAAKLHKAYPQTLLGAGIDAHGVYREKPEWVRIAISPYQRYVSFSEFVKRKDQCACGTSGGELWTCLTKEWWNTPNWVKGIEQKLFLEGKEYSVSTSK